MGNRPDPKAIETHPLHRQAKRVDREKNFKARLLRIKQHAFDIRRQVDALNPEPRDKQVIYAHIKNLVDEVDFVARELKLDD